MGFTILANVGKCKRKFRKNEKKCGSGPVTAIFFAFFPLILRRSRINSTKIEKKKGFLMNRREFLKSALVLAAIAPVAGLAAAEAAAKAGEQAGKTESSAPGHSRITRRRYKNTALTVPLLGFGMMRLPKINPDKPDIDYAAAEKLFDRAMEAGVNYFDTAYFYHGGKSEKCAGDLLTRYPRKSYLLASKLPIGGLKTEADVERVFNEQLAKCRTEYFDFYMLHALNAGGWKNAQRLHAYEFLKKKQAEGKIGKLGFSFHDTPEVLKTIAEAKQWDFVQLQINYLDWTLYRSKEQYEIVTKLGIPVIVMEPLRGSTLAKLNGETADIFRRANPDVSLASWAFRYAASLPNALLVLSGMTHMSDLEDNIKTFTDFRPLNDSERKTIASALTTYRVPGIVPCTACRYCMPCPSEVEIPKIFEIYNKYKVNRHYPVQAEYAKIPEDSRASACVKCGACVKKCPQKINIPKELERIAAELAGKGRGRKKA